MENFTKFLLIENHSFYFFFRFWSNGSKKFRKFIDAENLILSSSFCAVRCAKEAFRRCGHANHYIFRDQLIHSDAMSEYHLKKKRSRLWLKAIQNVNERMQVSLFFNFYIFSIDVDTGTSQYSFPFRKFTIGKRE